MEENNNNNGQVIDNQVIIKIQEKLIEIEKRAFKRKDQKDHLPSLPSENLDNENPILRVSARKFKDPENANRIGEREGQGLREHLKERSTLMWTARIVGFHWMFREKWAFLEHFYCYKDTRHRMGVQDENKRSSTKTPSEVEMSSAPTSTNTTNTNSTNTTNDEGICSKLSKIGIFFVRLFVFFAALIGFGGNMYINIRYSRFFWMEYNEKNVSLDKIYHVLLKVVSFNLTPLFQIGTIIYTLVKVYRELHDPEDKDRDTTRLHAGFINACKRDAFLCFLPFTIILIFPGCWTAFTPTAYMLSDDTGHSIHSFMNYEQFQFISICQHFFFYLNVALYLSLGLRETLAAQEDCLSKLMKNKYPIDDDEICTFFMSKFWRPCRCIVSSLRYLFCLCCCYKNEDDLQKGVCDCNNYFSCETCKPKYEYTIDLHSYYEIVEPTLKLIKSREWVVQLFIMSAFLNSISFLFIVAFYTNNYNGKDTVYSIMGYCPFLLKELFLFFYILSKGTKINTSHDKFMELLSEKILLYSKGVNKESIYKESPPCLEYTQALATIYTHASKHPIEFKCFGYRVTRGNLHFIIGGFLFTSIPLMIKVYNSSVIQETL